MNNTLPALKYLPLTLNLFPALCCENIGEAVNLLNPHWKISCSYMNNKYTTLYKIRPSVYTNLKIHTPTGW